MEKIYELTTKFKNADVNVYDVTITKEDLTVKELVDYLTSNPKHFGTICIKGPGSMGGSIDYPKGVNTPFFEGFKSCKVVSIDKAVDSWGRFDLDITIESGESGKIEYDPETEKKVVLFEPGKFNWYASNEYRPTTGVEVLGKINGFYYILRWHEQFGWEAKMGIMWVMIRVEAINNFDWCYLDMNVQSKDPL